MRNPAWREGCSSLLDFYDLVAQLERERAFQDIPRLIVLMMRMQGRGGPGGEPGSDHSAMMNCVPAEPMVCPASGATTIWSRRGSCPPSGEDSDEDSDMESSLMNSGLVWTRAQAHEGERLLNDGA